MEEQEHNVLRKGGPGREASVEDWWGGDGGGVRRWDGKRLEGATGGEVNRSDELQEGLHFGTVSTRRGWFVDAGERRRTSSPSKSPSRHAR